MSSRNNSQSDASQDAKSVPAAAPAEQVSAGAWKSTERIIRRKFPGPPGAAALLRVAVERAAYAELIAHAKESLDQETG